MAEDPISSLRTQILQIASERDKTLHTLPTTSDPHLAIHTALSSLPPTLSNQGLGLTQTLHHVIQDILPGLAPGHAGPRYLGFITGGVLPSAQLADFLTTIYDQNAGSNRTEESIAAVIEWRALEYTLDLLNLPRDAFPARILTSGATASNVLGLALARNHAVQTCLNSSTPYSVSESGFAGVTVKIYSDRPHASLLKAAALVGIGRANVIDLGKKLSPAAADSQEQVIGIDLEELEECLKKTVRPSSGSGVNNSSNDDTSAKTAAIVSVSFGEVNTGDFTPRIRQIRELCDKYNVWLHIDAAFGAYARLVPDIVGNIAEGLELGDSIATDAHKWLNVPYDCGIFFSRSIQTHQAIFTPSQSNVPAYLSRPSNPTPTPTPPWASSIPDPYTLSIENSRRFRGLALYTALLDRGRDGYAEIVRRNILFARRLAGWMESVVDGKGYYEVLNLRTMEVPFLGTGGGGGGVPSTQTIRTVPLNMLLFRARKSTNPIQAYTTTTGTTNGSSNLIKALNETKKIQVTPGENNAVRIAVSNWRTGLEPADLHHYYDHDLNSDHSDSDVGGGKGDFEIIVETLLSVVEHPPEWVVSLSSSLTPLGPSA